jgi:septal ring factor EnvC (AmiA/AmiB activator)
VFRLVVLLLLLLPGLAHPATGSRQEQLDALRDRIAKLKDDVEQAAEDRKEAADGLRESEQKISDLNRRLHDLLKNESRVSASLDQLGHEKAATETQLKAEEEKLAKLLQQRYRQGGDDSARLIMSGRSPGEVQRDLEYYAYIGRARAQLIENHRATLARLADIEAKTRDRQAELGRIKQSQLAQRDTLATEKRARQTTYDALSSQIRQQRMQIGSLVRDESRLSRLIQRLQKMAEEAKARRAAARETREAGSRKPPPGRTVKEVADASLAGLNFVALRGKLALPVIGEITARFGQARNGGGPSWKGLFIHSKEGQQVHAVASGEVVFADWLRGFGNLLIIDHGRGYLSLYSNNESLYKQAGDSVRAGDVVAAVGNSGGQEETGLYFELRHLGQPFDPLSWVK